MRNKKVMLKKNIDGELFKYCDKKIKMKKLLTILIIIGIFSLLVGCSQTNEESNPQVYFSKTELVRYSKVENNVVTVVSEEEQFDLKLKEFYDFSKEFFPVCDYYIESATTLLEKFNNKDITWDEKIEYSKSLRKVYEDFNNELIQINPPDEAYEAYQSILNAISKRILFFGEFEKGTSLDKLIEIEKDAYFYEVLFWSEIDKIYDRYLAEISKKNAVKI